MNAFLLITSAALAGADPAPAAKPGPVAGAPVAGAPVHGAPITSSAPWGSAGGSCCGGGGGDCGCGSSCDSCCESGGFFSKLKGRFHRSKGCGCEDTCDSCGGGHKSFGHASSCGCECASSCDSCCESGGFFSKLKGRFHRNKGCGCDDGCGCNSGCSSGGGYGTAGTVIGAPVKMAPAGEPIKAPKDSAPPKKLPSGGKVGIDPVPEVTPLPPVTTQGVGTNNNANPF
ncbi:MAG TPA: hypothetical protein VFE78_04980 [Gemmataceae bacterium]|nr:hypothetical protein [Gemmataceae bacterium]